MDVVPKVSIDIGKESFASLVEALRDTFSVVSEPLGLLGDYVRLYRMEVAERIAVRAKIIGANVGLTLTAPPVKFLAPFFERASSESEPELEELWARLLVEAGRKYSGRMLSYVDALSKMTHLEAMALCDLGATLPEYLGRPYEAVVYGSDAEKIRNAALETLFVNIERYSSDLVEKSARRAAKFPSNVQVTAGRLLWFAVAQFSSRIESRHGHNFHYSDAWEANVATYYGLEAKGLARVRHLDVFTGGGSRTDVCWVELTPLGVDLERVVHGRDAIYGE